MIMDEQNLYVIAVISNPFRYKVRYALYRNFEIYIKNSGAILYTVELAFNNRPFEVTQENNPFHIQLRSDQELWHKENMMNIGVSRLPPNAKYIAFVDADVTFSRPDWVNETLQQLQHYKVVQLFSHAQDLGPNFEPLFTHYGFCYRHVNKENPTINFIPGQCGEFHEASQFTKNEIGHPGYAWATTRETLDKIGGIVENNILGSGDMYFARSLVGSLSVSPDGGLFPGINPQYSQWLLKYQERVLKHIKKNIGYVSGTLSHYWHGKKVNRGYNWRYKLLLKNNFNPITDLIKDSYGLIRIDEDNTQLRDDVRMYFLSRNEDDISV